jgi:hypothetical protein
MTLWLCSVFSVLSAVQCWYVELELFVKLAR